MGFTFRACGMPHLFGAFLALGLLCSSLFSQEPDKKLPIPDTADREKTRKLVTEVYREDYKKAKTTAIIHRALQIQP